MADKYFRIKEGCLLYEDYFAHKADRKKIASVFTEVREKYGIETQEFYPSKKYFRIVPTNNDNKKFSDCLKKTSYGEFKKNSEISKMWIELIKDIEHMEKPRLIFYFDLLGHYWKERLFDIDGVLYCSIESGGEVSTPDFAEEMKASEFYKIVEDYEERNKK